MLRSKTTTRYEALRDKLPSAFTKAVLEGALRVLSDDNNPIRGNLFALGVREMMRHVLELKAPDHAVGACIWFQRKQRKEEKPNQITRRDRMIYATQGGITDEMLKELSLEPDVMHKALASTIDSLSKFTHVQPSTMLGAAAVTDALVDDVLDVLSEFLDSIEEFRAEVARVVSDAVNTEALSQFLVETHPKLDELSTHTQVQDAEVEHLEVVDIDARSVSLKGRGTVYAHLVYGSGSDERRGDGARISENYPFKMNLQVSVDDFSKMTLGVMQVDTTSFYEGFDNEED